MIQLNDVTVTVNNEAVGVLANTAKYTEGLGEQVIRAASTGGSVESVYADNIETKFSMISFEVPTTVETIAAVRSWKVNKNRNVVMLSGTNAEGTFTRTFQQAGVLNDYDVELGSETSINVDFKSNPAA
jgi:hypothetical protein